MRLPLILLTSLIREIVGDDHFIEGISYAVTGGWDTARCHRRNTYCSNHESFDNIAEFNKLCLTDLTHGCNELLDIGVTYNYTKLRGAQTGAIKDTIVFEYEEPLFPGGWILSGGIIKYPLDAYVNNTLEGCKLYYQEGEIQGTLSNWTLMSSCSFKYNQSNQYYELSCPQEQHGFCETKQIFYFAALKDGKNCIKTHKELLDKRIPLGMKGKMTFRRAKKTNKIAAIDRDQVKYTLEWAKSLNTTLPDFCSHSKISWHQGHQCIIPLSHNSDVNSLLSITVDIDGPKGHPAEIRDKGRNRHIPAVSFDLYMLLFLQDFMVMNSTWAEPMVGYAFNLNMSDKADMYVTHKFGYPLSDYHSGDRYELSASRDHPFKSDRLVFMKPAAEIGRPRVIFVDKELKPDTMFKYDGFIKISRSKPAHEIQPTEMGYSIRWLHGCGTVSDDCHKPLHYAEAKTCLDKVPSGCKVRISSSIEPPLSLSAIEVSINEKKISVPVVLYNPTKLFFSSVKLSGVELASYSFGDQAEGDLFISEHLGGNPPQGKVTDPLVHLSPSKVQYIYLDHPIKSTDHTIKSTDHKFIFTGKFIASGAKP